jgi:hypothetical protein
MAIQEIYRPSDSKILVTGVQMVQSSPQQKASQTDKNERETDTGNRDRTLVVVPKKNDLYFFFT